MMAIDQDDLYNDDDEASLDDQRGGQVVPEVGDQLPAAARTVGHLSYCYCYCYCCYCYFHCYYYYCYCYCYC